MAEDKTPGWTRIKNAVKKGAEYFSASAQVERAAKKAGSGTRPKAASTGGPARYKAPAKASSGGPARYKAPTASAGPKTRAKVTGAGTTKTSRPSRAASMESATAKAAAKRPSRAASMSKKTATASTGGPARYTAGSKAAPKKSIKPKARTMKAPTVSSRSAAPATSKRPSAKSGYETIAGSNAKSRTREQLAKDERARIGLGGKRKQTRGEDR